MKTRSMATPNTYIIEDVWKVQTPRRNANVSYGGYTGVTPMLSFNHSLMFNQNQCLKRLRQILTGRSLNYHFLHFNIHFSCTSHLTHAGLDVSVMMNKDVFFFFSDKVNLPPLKRLVSERIVSKS